MEILPPFETPVGRVGLAICFDVSGNLGYALPSPKTLFTTRKMHYSHASNPILVTLPRDKSGFETSERPANHVSLCLHGSDRNRALGSIASRKSY